MTYGVERMSLACGSEEVVDVAQLGRQRCKFNLLEVVVAGRSLPLEGPITAKCVGKFSTNPQPYLVQYWEKKFGLTTP